MTQEMEVLYNKLITVKTQSIKAAFRHVRAELELIDLDCKVDIGVTEKDFNKVKKGLRKLNRVYKGKSSETAQSVYESYPVDSTEYFVLMCVARILDSSAKSSIF